MGTPTVYSAALTAHPARAQHSLCPAHSETLPVHHVHSCTHSTPCACALYSQHLLERDLVLRQELVDPGAADSEPRVPPQQPVPTERGSVCVCVRVSVCVCV